MGLVSAVRDGAGIRAFAEGLPQLGVVMPCRNEADMIRRSVASVLAFDYPAGRMTLTVVDGMSDDATPDIVAEIALADRRVRLLQNPQRLPASALNLAIAALDCDVLLRVDAHSIYPRDYAMRCVTALQETGAANVGGVIETRPGADTPTARAIAFSLGHRFGVGTAAFRTGAPARQWVDTVPFGCWRLETLRSLGGFATDIPFGEDDELNGRLRAKGGRVLLDPAIRSDYVARATLWAFMVMMFRYGRSKPATARRLGRVTTVRQLVPPVFVAVVTASALLGMAWPPAAVPGVAAVGAHLVTGASVGVVAWAAGRLEALAAICLPHTFLAGHVAYGAGYVAGMNRFLHRSGHG